MADVMRLSVNITEETLHAATRLHNQFPPDTAFPQIDILSDGFEQLCVIIAKYSLQSYFRLRLLHRHMTIPEGQILFGTSIPERYGYWTGPTLISDIDLQNVHGHIFSLDTASPEMNNGDGEIRNVLIPSEFREGPSASVGTINGNFFTEFTDCLRSRGLGKTIGLEAIHDQATKMVEFSFDTGSLLLREEEVRGQYNFKETGWTIIAEDGVVDKEGETRCVITEGKHWTATRVQVNGVLDALKVLGDGGLLM